MSRLKQKKLADCALIVCETCKGRAVNPDYHPGSLALTRCCPDCNGLGKMDKETGPLAVEQVAEYWRHHFARVQNENKRLKEDLAAVAHALRVIEAHAPPIKKTDLNAPPPGFYEETSKRPFGAVSSD